MIQAQMPIGGVVGGAAVEFVYRFWIRRRAAV